MRVRSRARLEIALRSMMRDRRQDVQQGERDRRASPRARARPHRPALAASGIAFEIGRCLLFQQTIRREQE